MFGIGFFELVVIAVVALIFVGPQRLPEVMKQAGRFFVQMRRTANDVKSTFDGVIRQAEDEIRREEAEAMRALLAKSATETTALPAPTHAADDDHNPDGTLKSMNPPPEAAPPGAQPYSPPAPVIKDNG
jgi:sec-independent protein translocase protein TatB